MANVSVYNMEGSEVGKIDLNDNVFAAKVNEHLMHMAVVLQLIALKLTEVGGIDPDASKVLNKVTVTV